MKAHIIYDADGTQHFYIKGFLITTQLFKNGTGLVKVFNKKGREVRAYNFNKAYFIELDKRT